MAGLGLRKAVWYLWPRTQRAETVLRVRVIQTDACVRGPWWDEATWRSFQAMIQFWSPEGCWPLVGKLSTVTRALPRKHHPELDSCLGRRPRGSQALPKSYQGLGWGANPGRRRNVLGTIDTLSRESTRWRTMPETDSHWHRELCHGLPGGPDSYREVLTHSVSSYTVPRDTVFRRVIKVKLNHWGEPYWERKLRHRSMIWRHRHGRRPTGPRERPQKKCMTTPDFWLLTSELSRKQARGV